MTPTQSPFEGRGACHRAGHFEPDPLAATSGWQKGRPRVVLLRLLIRFCGRAPGAPSAPCGWTAPLPLFLSWARAQVAF